MLCSMRLGGKRVAQPMTSWVPTGPCSKLLVSCLAILSRLLKTYLINTTLALLKMAEGKKTASSAVMKWDKLETSKIVPLDQKIEVLGFSVLQFEHLCSSVGTKKEAGRSPWIQGRKVPDTTAGPCPTEVLAPNHTAEHLDKRRHKDQLTLWERNKVVIWTPPGYAENTEIRSEKLM